MSRSFAAHATCFTAWTLAQISKEAILLTGQKENGNHVAHAHDMQLFFIHKWCRICIFPSPFKSPLSTRIWCLLSPATLNDLFRVIHTHTRGAGSHARMSQCVLYLCHCFVIPGFFILSKRMEISHISDYCTASIQSKRERRGSERLRERVRLDSCHQARGIYLTYIN